MKAHVFWLIIKMPILFLHGVALSQSICQEPLYQYQQKCYVECPIGTTPNEINRTCLDKSNNLALWFNHKKPSSEFNIYCPPKMCKPPLNKCFELKCLKACPPGTYLYRNMCLRHCPTGLHIFNKTCEISCPTTFMFTFKVKNNSFCTNKCPVDTVIINTTCDFNCPIDNPLHFNQSCLSQCPEYSKFMVITTKNNKALVKCVSTCPGDLLFQGNVCVERCSQEKALFNKSCLDACPKSHPFCYHTNRYSPDRKITRICKENCPHNSRIMDNNCYDVCPKNTFRYNNNCLKKCPASHPYQKQIFSIFMEEEIGCVSHCSNPFGYLQENRCVNNCLPPLLLMNSTCVDNCSDEFPFQLKREIDLSGGLECVSNCPETTVVFENSCLHECPRNSSYIFNRTCLTKCPNAHPLVDIDNRNSCRSECNHFQYESTCLTKCPESLVGHNSICLSECPVDKPFLDLAKRECVVKCPGIQNNGTCLNKCPKNTYRYHNQCVLQCPSGFYADINNGICIKRCPKFHNESFCLEKCPNMYTLNQKCLLKCPNETRYVMTSVRVSYRPYGYFQKEWKWTNTQPKCVTSCPSNYFVLVDKCLNFCPEGYNFTFRQQCRKQCPPSYLYTSVNVNTFSPIKTIFKCVPECPRNMVYENEMCKNQCSISSKYVVYNKCHKQCPVDRPLHFKYQDDKTNSIRFTCLSHCPEHSYKINSSCVLFCPSEYFGFNGNCVKYCPSSHSLNYSKVVENGFAYFCERNCPVNTFLIGENCYDVCPDSTHQYSKTCVYHCPISHKFHRHVVIHKKYQSVICEKTCPKFSFFNECVESCPLNQSFIHNKQCVPRCPKSRPLAPITGDRFCYDSCPKGNLSFRGKHCIESCAMIYVIYNKTCLERCPSKFVYFEITNQGILCRDKCYNGFVLSGKECVPKCPVTTYNLQGVCQSIKRCPDRYPFEENRKQGRTCTDKCLQTNVLYKRFCESGCPFGYVIFDGKCLKHCPEHVPNELHKSAINFQYQVYCYNSCPTGYVSKNKACIKEKNCYNAGNILHKGRCIAECPSNLLVADNTNKHNRFCTDSCPSGFALYNQICILEDNCYSLKKYVLNRRCIKDCKFRYYQDKYTKTRILCGEKCPNEHVLDDEKSLCIDEMDCNNAGKFLYSDKCISKCPPGHFITTVSYTYKGCSSSCTGNYHNGTHCQKCESPLILNDGSCIKSCPVLQMLSRTLFSERICISAVPILLVLVLSFIVIGGCVFCSWYVFIYNYADRKVIQFQEMLSKKGGCTYTKEMAYDDEETCPLQLDIDNNDTPPFMQNNLQNLSSNTAIDIGSEVSSLTSKRTENTEREIQEFQEERLLDVNEHHLEEDKETVYTSSILDSQPDEITQLKYEARDKDKALEHTSYQIHDIPNEKRYDDDSYDDIDSITEVKSAFKENEYETSCEQMEYESDKLNKSVLKVDLALSNSETDHGDCSKHLKNETFCLDLFGKESENGETINFKTKETEA